MAEYIEREVTCADCIHCDGCYNPIVRLTGMDARNCVDFKNKSDREDD